MAEESKTTKLKALEEELDDILEEKTVALARPMRGAEKDNLRRYYQRQESRLRKQIEAIKATLKEVQRENRIT